MQECTDRDPSEFQPRTLIYGDVSAIAQTAEEVVDYLDRGYMLLNQFEDKLEMVTPTPPEVEPIPMILYCPSCGTQHIDSASEKDGWTNPPHRSHLCYYCGTIWRPADVCTTGVKQIQTRGKKDSAALTPWR